MVAFVEAAVVLVVVACEHVVVLSELPCALCYVCNLCVKRVYM